ncbi:MAG: S1C family serine protease [Gaiellales bacterium]
MRWARQIGLLIAAGVVGGVIVAAVAPKPATKVIRTVHTVGAKTLPASSVNESVGLTPAQIYQQDAPGVVVVRATTISRTTNIFGVPQTQQEEALGSGFVIDRKGHILTNAHVVLGARSVRVGFANSTGLDKTYSARVLGLDKATDVAVLEPRDVPSQALDPLPLGTAKDAHVGDAVVAIGNPLGEERTITSGIISAVNRTINSLEPNRPISGALQTDAAINHGNSGGPLIASNGRVIGITSQILSDGSGPQSGNIGIGFAIPIDTAMQVARQLISSGHAQHTYLGILGETLTSQVLKALNIPSAHGVLIARVVPGSPAATAGLRGGSTTATMSGTTYELGGDVIVALDGKPISQSTQLADAISARKPGQKVTLTIIRDGKQQDVSVTLAAESGG